MIIFKTALRILSSICLDIYRHTVWLVKGVDSANEMSQFSLLIEYTHTHILFLGTSGISMNNIKERKK